MHHQDKLLIIEALVAYGGDPREQRAWDLAERMLDGEDSQQMRSLVRSTTSGRGLETKELVHSLRYNV